ncbi:Arm DNA-binding domain-containing protein [Cupriavidus basilensis]
MPGLGLRVTATGARAYVFESRLFAKTVRMTIGSPKAWDLAKARTEAARLKTVIDAGQDPRELMAEARTAHEARAAAAAAQAVTVGEVWPRYLEEAAAQAQGRLEAAISCRPAGDGRAWWREEKAGQGHHATGAAVPADGADTLRTD